MNRTGKKLCVFALGVEETEDNFLYLSLCIQNYEFKLILFFSILTAASPPSPSSPLPLAPFQKREASHEYQPAIAHQVAVRLGTSSIEKRQSNPVGVRGPKGRQRSQRQPLLPLFRIPHKDQTT